MSIRTHAESVAFYDSSNNELVEMNKTFDDLISKNSMNFISFLKFIKSSLISPLEISYRRNWKEFFLKLWVNILQYLGAILSYLILAVPIFSNVYDNYTPGQLAQLISNYSFICGYVVYYFTRLYDLSNEISIIAGNSHRIG